MVQSSMTKYAIDNNQSRNNVQGQAKTANNSPDKIMSRPKTTMSLDFGKLNSIINA